MNIKRLLPIIITAAVLMLSGCGKEVGENNSMQISEVIPNSNIEELEVGLSAVSVEGDYRFDEFLQQGGANSDSGVVEFLYGNISDSSVFKNIFGCSTLSTVTDSGEAMFGRNFDWQKCNAMIVSAKPDNGYASISTVNMDFIPSVNKLPDNIKTLAALYAPLDGMNEKGLCVSVNMIQDSDGIEQNSERDDITTTTAIRMLLDKAADTDEAVRLLGGYDMHASKGMMVHFAIADNKGKSVVVEYIDNEMSVVETPVVTNFYLTEGEKYGVGTGQSRERYEILTELLANNPPKDTEDMRNALDSVSKDNFNEFESTEWSIVFNQSRGEAVYYHREDYTKEYSFRVGEQL